MKKESRAFKEKKVGHLKKERWWFEIENLGKNQESIILEV
jgi:hypothetical protein